MSWVSRINNKGDIRKKTFDLEMTLRSTSRSKVTKVNGECPGSLGSILREI